MPARRPRTPRTRDQLVPFQAKTNEGKERLLGELSRRAVDTERRQGSVESRVSAVETGLEELEEEVSEIVTSGPVPSSRTISTSGGLTGGGDLTANRTLSILDNGVTLAKLADVASATILGRSTAGTGDPEALTATQATALLDVFTAALKGLVPASGGSAADVLHGDGTWSPASSNTFVSAGTGLDGAVTFDGVSTVLGLSPSSGVYTLDRDIFPSTMTVNAGVTVDTANRRIFASGRLTHNGVISCDGNDASGGTAGAARAAGFFGASTAGGAGGLNGVGQGSGTASNNLPNLPVLSTNTSSNAGNAGSAGSVGQVPCKGGGGGGGTSGSGSGGKGGDVTKISEGSHGGTGLAEMRHGRVNFTNSTAITAASGGGGGAALGANQAGGGGGGGSYVYVEAKEIVGSGVFRARGGAGADGAGTTSGGGGGGGGGIVVIICGAASGTWTTDVSGGAGGAGGSSGFAGGDGADGVAIAPVTP